MTELNSGLQQVPLQTGRLEVSQQQVQQIRFDPRGLLLNIEKSDRGQLRKLTGRIVGSLLKQTPGGEVIAGRVAVVHYQGTSAATKTDTLLATVQTIAEDQHYQGYLQEGGKPIRYVYFHLMDDYLRGIELKDCLGLERNGQKVKPRNLENFQYNLIARGISAEKRWLVITHRRLDEPTLILDDRNGLTGLPLDGMLSGPDRGGTEGLMSCIAAGIPTFLIGANVPEYMKRENMSIRKKVLQLPLQQIHPFLEKVGVKDDRKPGVIRKSYERLGDEHLLSLQHQAIGRNAYRLIQRRLLEIEMPFTTMEELRSMSEEELMAWYLTDEGKDRTLPPYIQVWQRLVLSTTEADSPNAVLIEPQNLRERFEPRSFTENHDVADYLQQRLDETGSPTLMGTRHIWAKELIV